MPFDNMNLVRNEAFINDLVNGMTKTAQEAADSFLRMRVREDGVVREILPPIPVTTEDFAPQVDTDEPVIVVEKEIQSPGAISMPFGDNNPPAVYIRGTKFRVVLRRISSPTLRKDEAELATYRADIRQLLAEMLVKDLSWEEDSTFIRMVNTLLGGSPNSPNIISGVVQWKTIPGGISRVTIGDAFKATFIPKSRIPVTKILCNAGTTAELFKWERSEVGGDDAQNILYEGWGKRSLNNAQIVTTIKRELIEDDTLYMFGHSNFIGKFFVWQEPSLYVVKEDTELRFRAHEIVGMAIGHVDAVFRFDFVTT
jgi:hypothetical protein